MNILVPNDVNYDYEKANCYIYADWLPAEDVGDCCYRCSNCGKILDMYRDDDNNYCARCGATMRSGDMRKEYKERPQRNKYLDNLNIPLEEYGVNHSLNDNRAEKWAKERALYGFDERETWCLDQMFIEWLYSRLMMYKEITPIVLSYHKFQFDGKEYTQEECIDYILERLKIALTTRSPQFYNTLEIRDAIRMWAEVFSACWW